MSYAGTLVRNPNVVVPVLGLEAGAARDVLERAWGSDTAHHSVLPLLSTERRSRGQCGVSAVWAGRHLVRLGWDVRFTEGTLDLEDGTQHPYVWLTHLQDTGKLKVIDETHDQFAWRYGGGTVYIGDPKSHIGEYRAEEMLDPFNVPRRKLMARYAILERRIERQQRWRRFVRALVGQ